MLFSWLRQHRRRKILAQPFPPAWLQHLRENVAYFHFVSEPEQKTLLEYSLIFISEKSWEGCGGLEMSDEIKVTVAAQACLLVLGLDIDQFRRVQTILVYPAGYMAPHQEVIGENAVLEAETPLLGQAHYRGPVILAWDKVVDEGRNPGGDNLVFHEFAHQLDMLNGSLDGTPPLRNKKQARDWRRVMTAEFRHLCVESSRGRRTLLDPYGATNESEFFAVATECFFSRPVALKEIHPRLYEVFADYYCQNPAGWRRSE
jgi:Mlc titration factor MtfA (ptsG expression regulator)